MNSATTPGLAKLARSSRTQRGGSKSGERRGGRKAGTPNKATAEIKGLARQYGAAAIERLAHLMTQATSEAAQVAAARELLDRGYGRPTQAIAGDPDGAPIGLTIYTGVDRGYEGDEGGDE
jgi:phage protein D